MTCCILHNVPRCSVSEMAQTLRASFPSLVAEIILVSLRDCSLQEGAFCTIHWSSETSEDEIRKIRIICERYCEVRERERPAPGEVFYYDRQPQVSAQIKDILQMNVTWVNSTPRLLNGEMAPYVEVHGSILDGQLANLRELLDVELWQKDLVEFCPKV